MHTLRSRRRPVKSQPRKKRPVDPARASQPDPGWEALVQTNAPGNLEISARAFGALIRRRGIESAQILLRLILAYGISFPSLDETVAWAARAGVAQLSKVALQKRLKGARHWMAHLVALELLRREWHWEALPPLTVVIQDATTISLAGSEGTDYRVHLVVDLAQQRITRLALTDAHGGESFQRFQLPNGSVVLGDRIYGTRQGIVSVRRGGGHALGRINWQNLPLQDKAGKRLDLLALARQCPWNAPLEVEGFTVPDAKADLPAVPVRLIIARKPPEGAERARRKARKESIKKGHTPRQETL